MIRWIFIIIVACAIVAGGFYAVSKYAASATPSDAKPQSEIRLDPRTQMTPAQAALVKEPSLAAEVEQILTKEEGVLAAVTTDAVVLDAVRSANAKDKSLSMAEITTLDKAWIASKTTTAAMQAIMQNAASQKLLAFQAINPGFKEIFVADAYGLNAAETDKTSDYYQADEAWWVNSFNGGTGKIIHGPIEFDQSSQTEAISLYIPVIDPSTGTAIGVMKGVLDLSSVSNQL